MIGHQRQRVCAVVLGLSLIGGATASPAVAADGAAPADPVAPVALSVSVGRVTALAPDGEVVLGGTADCSEPTLLWLSGTVQQDATTTTVAQALDCSGDTVTWSATTQGRQGPPLRTGAAVATFSVTSLDDSDAVAVTTRTLRLRGPRIVFARSVSSAGHDPFRSEIFTIAGDGSGQTRLTSNAVEDTHPAFSPDGRRIAFTSSRSGRPSIYVMNADGSRVRRMTSGGVDSLPDWSPDGKWIVFSRYYAKQRQSDLVRVRVADRVTRRITRTRARELRSTWSPDGTLIAFTKLLDADERHGIAVIRPGGTGTRWLTRNPRSRAGLVDEAPTWSPRSSHIAFTRELSDRNSDIFTVRRQGTSVRRLTTTGGQARLPAWGADGRLALVHDGALAIMLADGTGLRAVAGEAPARPYGFPDWAGTVAN